jgi:uncharacterized membrane protein YfcA
MELQILAPARLRVSAGQAIMVAAVLPWVVLLYLGLLVYSALFRGAIDPALFEWHWSALLPFVAIGFLAQLIDGSLGMGFGVISNAMLLAMGLPPSSATSGVHTAEGFASGASAVSHAWQGNIDWRLFARLVLPGIVGGVLGAALIMAMRTDFARPLVLAYLAAVGLYLLWRGLHRPSPVAMPRVIQPLGFAGGLFDAAGGGGWGPIVTGNLLLQGAAPAKVVGTVSLSEFFVTITISAILIGSFGLAAFTTATIGLLVGGVAAAPLGALLARRIPARLLTGLAGVLLTLTAAYGFVGGWAAH